ncbi:MAG: hypothetical protein Q9165_005804 [Trypethelium subeluteriae]
MPNGSQSSRLQAEMDRMDIYHKLFLVARRDSLHLAPIVTRTTPRILDLGCGTGIWAIDMADPIRIPPNLRFRINFDYEGHWAMGQDSWDLIHVRMACGSVSSWPELYQKIFLHLKPGDGYMEQVEIDLQPRCDDGTLLEGALKQWYDCLKDATARISRPIEYQHNTRQMLQAAGFIDINETVIRAPYNSWPADPHQKEIGRWYNLGLTEGLEALSLAPFTRVYQWPVPSVGRIVEDAKRQIVSKKQHGYNNMYVVFLKG